MIKKDFKNAINNSIKHYKDAIKRTENNWKEFDYTSKSCDLCKLYNECKLCPLSNKLEDEIYKCCNEWQRLSIAVNNNDYNEFIKIVN